MKKIITLLFICALFSCKKESVNNCFTCHLQGAVNGETYNEYREYCGPEPIPHFTNSVGSVIPSTCVKK